MEESEEDKSREGLGWGCCGGRGGPREKPPKSSASLGATSRRSSDSFKPASYKTERDTGCWEYVPSGVIFFAVGNPAICCCQENSRRHIWAFKRETDGVVVVATCGCGDCTLRRSRTSSSMCRYSQSWQQQIYG